MYRIAVPMMFCPRFSVEALTPIVRVTPSEMLVVRLTNHSRDGVRDFVHVDDSLAVAPKRQFRLSVKDQVHQDTLVLTWKRALDEGTYVVPVKIATQEVARFAARQFEARVDSTKSVALLAGIESSPTADALRRIGAHWTMLKVDSQLAGSLAAFQVVLLDRRVLTLRPDILAHERELSQFVEKGGHLIVLAQDADREGLHGVVEGLELTSAEIYDERTDMEADSSHRLLTWPNTLQAVDWMNWLYRRAFNAVGGRALDRATVPLRAAKDRNPLIAQWKKAAGTITYVDLALHPQFMNVHPGAYRLLANLISY